MIVTGFDSFEMFLVVVYCVACFLAGIGLAVWRGWGLDQKYIAEAARLQILQKQATQMSNPELWEIVKTKDAGSNDARIALAELKRRDDIFKDAPDQQTKLEQLSNTDLVNVVLTGEPGSAHNRLAMRELVRRNQSLKREFRLMLEEDEDDKLPMEMK